MALKHEELSNPNSCFSKASLHERVFVLIGRDPAFSETIRFWAHERVSLRKNEPNDPQIREALALADAAESGPEPAKGGVMAEVICEYPKICTLCGEKIGTRIDLDFHGLGNCAPICIRCNGSGIEPTDEVGAALSLRKREEVMRIYEIVTEYTKEGGIFKRWRVACHTFDEAHEEAVRKLTKGTCIQSIEMIADTEL